jgi:uncharacterized protein (TIGR02757 family)
MISPDIIGLLNEAVSRYNRPEFISSDPISIPHSFKGKEDIEIAGFLAATLSWGQRGTIIGNSQKLMQLMDSSPYDFILNTGDKDLACMSSFVHRTFNGDDCLFFIHALRFIYHDKGGMEQVFTWGYEQNRSIREAIIHFREVFLSIPHLNRSSKHFSNPAKGASAKRINMFLRWMVRQDDHGVDFGLWKSVSPAHLLCPLDLHSGRVARKLGLLTRKQDDWKAVEELTANLRLIDPTDPVRYDFALFGLGIFERF